MDDKQILDLYWERSEAAISETSKKYGNSHAYIVILNECLANYLSLLIFYLIL